MAAEQNVGKIVEIRGVVLDAAFEERLPGIYSALSIDLGEGRTLIAEVQQHLGDDRVRAVAMDSTDGLPRGIAVVDTGAAISVPVGDVTLGRLWNVIGDPIDEKGDVPEGTERWRSVVTTLPHTMACMLNTTIMAAATHAVLVTARVAGRATSTNNPARSSSVAPRRRSRAGAATVPARPPTANAVSNTP